MKLDYNTNFYTNMSKTAATDKNLSIAKLVVFAKRFFGVY